MLQGIIVKKILDSIMKQLLKQFKLDKIQAYVEKPNELDKQMKQVQKNLSKYGKYIESLEKEVAILKDVASKTESIKDKFSKLKF
jgi:predicted nuclease with TOPRIM domain